MNEPITTPDIASQKCTYTVGLIAGEDVSLTERTVAEIIGWEKFPDSGDSYEVDDLLAWLADQGWCTDIEYLIDHPTPVFIALHHNDYEDGPDLRMATSVLAGLEAAVRAVAETPSYPAPRTDDRGSGAVGCGDGGDGGRPR